MGNDGMIENEAEVSTDEEVDQVSQSSDEDEEEGLDEDLDDFVVKEDEVEEGGEGEEEHGSGHKKKKRRRHLSEEELTDDDYDLLQENLGVKMKRKKFSRVRVESSDEEEEKKEDDREELAKQLFDSDDDEVVEETTGPPADKPADKQRRPMDSDLGSESETEVDDFIVDERGRPVKREDRSRTHMSSAMREAEEIFGDGFEFDKIQDELEDDFDEAEDDYSDDEEAMESSRRRKKKKKAEVNIYDIYEPADLEKGHFTSQDHDIKITDLPERFQLRSLPIEEADDLELEQEAAWIYAQAFSTKPISYQGDLDDFGEIMMWTPKPKSTESKIKNVLKQIRNDKFEVPFIATYRKECIKDDLTTDDLWRVYHWDERWARLKKRKAKLKSLMMKIQQYQYERTRESAFIRNERVLEAEDIDRVDSIQTVDEFKDINAHFSLYYGSDIVDLQNLAKTNAVIDGLGTADQCKLSQKRSNYKLCVEKNIGNLTERFGLTSRQFAENLTDQYNRHTVEQCALMPDEAAKEFTDTRRFTGVDKVLSAARYMIACQIAAEPSVRAAVRSTYYDRALLSITPTPSGIKEIDDNHPYAKFKFIKDKPVKELTGDEFLRMWGAQQEGYVKLSLSIHDTGAKDSYLDEIKMFFYRDEFSNLVQTWNEQRTEALTLALKTMLYPLLEKELLQKLKDESSHHFQQTCKMKLRRWLKMAPYTVENLDQDISNSVPGLRVLGLVVFDNEQDKPGHGVLINGDGEVEETIALTYYRCSTKGATVRDWAKGKVEDMVKLKEFLLENRPHVIALNCSGRAMIYTREIQEIVTALEQQHQIKPIAIELVDPTIAMVYKESSRAQCEFPSFCAEQRVAVSIARRLRDPLTEIAQLCNFTNDILTLPWGLNSKFVSKERLKQALHEEFIDKVNEVGVDLNFAMEHYHYSALIQFVCGFGPRKADALLKLLKQSNDPLESRAALVTHFNLGGSVFLNCAGFIRIEHSRDDSLSENIELLDSTRIHPETYIWATKMAIDALDYNEDDEDSNVKQRALEDIMEDPEKLKDLDLLAFAIELERQGYPDKRITLYDIRDELTNRYADKRTPYQPLTDEDRFYLLSNESPETFKIGQVVQCKVYAIARRKPKGDEPDIQPKRNEETGMWQCPLCLRDNFPELSEIWNHFDTSGSCPGQAVGIRVRLDNGIPGFIATKNISDSKVANPEERIKINQQIVAKVTRILFDKSTVDLSCKTSDLNSASSIEKDVFYDTEAADKIKKEKEAKKSKKQKNNQYITRLIVHPNFKNCTYVQCEKFLQSEQQGHCIFRPSRKGTQFLTLTWKVDQQNNILAHDEIVEEEKDNQFSLGKKLKIHDEEFEDLDEIIARYVEPMSRNALDILKFKYYQGVMPEETISKLLGNDKALTPNRIPYYITSAKDIPGKPIFKLSYMPSKRAQHELIKVSHVGFKFRGKIHSSFSSLIAWFKEHYGEAPPAPQMGAKAASTVGGKSAVTDYTADFTDFTEPFQTPRSGATQSEVGTVYSGVSRASVHNPPPAAAAYKAGSATPGHRTPGGRTPYDGHRVPPSTGHRTPYNDGHRTPYEGHRTPSQRSHYDAGGRTPGYSGSRTPGGRTPGALLPGNRTPGGIPPGSRTPGGIPPGNRTPGSRTPSGMPPGSRTPSGMPPGSRTPSGMPPSGSRTPGYRTPGGMTPGGGGGRTPGHRTPSGMTPGGSRTPGHRTPGYGTPGSGYHGGNRTPHQGHPPGPYPGQYRQSPSSRRGDRTPVSLMDPPPNSQGSHRARTPVA